MNRVLFTSIVFGLLGACNATPTNFVAPIISDCSDPNSGCAAFSSSPCVDDTSCAFGEYCDQSGVCAIPECGNTVIEPGEECDDGNTNDHDACTDACTDAVCGDGLVQTFIEQCDDGNGTNDDGCDSNCQLSGPAPLPPECGNGVVETGEECDDGNTNDNDACLTTCVATTCGDGLVYEGVEACDLGAFNSNNGACLDNCAAASCGDGFIWSGEEQCDDGNNDNDDGCRNDCTLPFCGNGAVDPGETCDDGDLIEGNGCDTNCTPSGCGNGIVDPAEECDDTNAIDTDACRNDCTLAACGDGVVWTNQETCDDGNTDNGDGCDNNCTPSACGNGIVDPTEQCEPGDPSLAALNYVCNSSCLLECADGWVNHNVTSSDGCELNVGSDPLNCGAFAYSCGGGTCTDGVCDDFTVVSDSGLVAFAVDDTHVYYANTGGVRRQAKDGTGAHEVVLVAAGNYTSMSVEGANLYYVADNVLYRMDKAGSGSPLTLYTGTGSVTFAVDNGTIYYGDSGSGLFQSMATDGTGNTAIGIHTGESIGDIKVETTHVYWRSNNGSAYKVHRSPVAGPASPVAVLNVTVTGAFAYDVAFGFIAFVNGDMWAIAEDGSGVPVLVLPNSPSNDYVDLFIPGDRPISLRGNLSSGDVVEVGIVPIISEIAVGTYNNLISALAETNNTVWRLEADGIKKQRLPTE